MACAMSSNNADQGFEWSMLSQGHDVAETGIFNECMSKFNCLSRTAYTVVLAISIYTVRCCLAISNPGIEYEG